MPLKKTETALEETKEAKRLYDIEYRRKNKEKIKARNIRYNESPAGRAMQKRHREKQKEDHLEYCRTPEYRRWKKHYDRKNNAKAMYGDFWEVMTLVDIIQKRVRKIVPDKYERMKLRGFLERLRAKEFLKRHFRKRN